MGVRAKRFAARQAGARNARRSASAEDCFLKKAVSSSALFPRRQASARTRQPARLTVKIIHALTLAGLMALATAALPGAQDIKINLDPNKPAAAPAASTPAPAPAAAPKQFTDEQKLEVWGWLLAQQIGLTELGFSATDVNAIARGMALNVQGRDPGYPPEIGAQLEALLKARAEVAKARQEKMIAATRDENLKAADAFVATLKGKPGIVELPSGLRYEIVQPGKGPKPRADQMVKINYRGTFPNGEEFDSSTRRGQPAEFILANVAPGWSEGIQQIQLGGKIKLYVPSKIGFGDDGRGPLPPGAFHIMEIELLEIKDAPPQPAAPAAK
jgi:FKBP-type peptidyl-prolyl cis-trans isomerase